MANNLYELIKKNERRGDFTHADVTEEKVAAAEDMLGNRLPAEYKRFLQAFGHGGIGGIEVLGVGKDGTLVFVNETLKYRTYGMPNHLVAIENCDEWVYCVDATDGEVVMWSIGEAHPTVAFESFEFYLLERLNDMLENMAL